MHSLAVGSVSCYVCADRRRLRCAIWAAGLRTAFSSGCAAAYWVLCVLGEVSLQRLCQSSLIMASLIGGSLKRLSAPWCVWLCVGQPSCCCRVSAGDQPTSVSLHAWRGHVLKCTQSSGVVWSHWQQVSTSGM